MALTMPVSLPSGLAAPAAYIRVTAVGQGGSTVNGANATTTGATVRVATFANQAARQAGSPPILPERAFPVDPASLSGGGEALIAAAYGAIKALPAFAGATDC